MWLYHSKCHKRAVVSFKHHSGRNFGEKLLHNAKRIENYVCNNILAALYLNNEHIENYQAIKQDPYISPIEWQCDNACIRYSYKK